jgi:hypothetical protein
MNCPYGLSNLFKIFGLNCNYGDDDNEEIKLTDLENNLFKLIEYNELIPYLKSEFAPFNMNIIDLPDLSLANEEEILKEISRYNSAPMEKIINKFQSLNILELRLIHILVKLGRSDINIKINEFIESKDICNKRDIKKLEVEQAEPKKKFRMT